MIWNNDNEWQWNNDINDNNNYGEKWLIMMVLLMVMT